MLPSLQNLFVEGLSHQDLFRRFVVARRLSGYPIAISDWGKGSIASRFAYHTFTHPLVLPTPTPPPSLQNSRSVYPPVSHRAGQQLVSSVYGDAGSERTCRHQEYEHNYRCVLIFYAFWVATVSYTVLYYARSTDYVTSTIDGRFPSENPLRTVLYLMYHHVMSSFFTKQILTALAQDPSARMKLKIL